MTGSKRSSDPSATCPSAKKEVKHSLTKELINQILEEIGLEHQPVDEPPKESTAQQKR